MENNEGQHCNISGVEVKKRLMVGYIGFALTIIWLIVIYIFKIPSWTIFPFAFMSAIGFIQAKFKYCVAFATMDILKDPIKFKNEIFYIFKTAGISFLLSLGFTFIVWWVNGL